MGVQLSVQDIREHGLTIIGPGDASFDGMLNGARGNMSGVPLDAIRPYTVFIKNTGRRAVVAFILKWELVRPDGKANTRTDQYVTQYSLMGDGVSDSEGHAIKANTAWLAFPGFATAQDTPIWDNGGPKVAAYFDSMSNDLAQFSKINVSLDGVFFEDGAFVGPDTTGFYGKVEALIRADQDLRDELETRRKSGKSADDVLTHVTEEAGKPKVRLGRNSTADDYYNYFKRSAAKELLEMRNLSGSEKTLEHALRPLKGPRPVLRKE
ncbi:MAG: hypothetical protein M3444_04500 [Acidobacteriota bacterium]|nr:hypothetical protein [Acidobacteriota bacterium]